MSLPCASTPVPAEGTTLSPEWEEVSVRRSRQATVAASLVLLGTGCSQSEEPSGGAATVTETVTTTVTPSALTPSPNALEGFRTSTATSTGFPDGGYLGSGDSVRVGQHDGYDRVVYGFTEDGSPAYRVRYVPRPIGDPSGRVVDVPGDAYLEVVVTGLGYPTEAVPSPSVQPSEVPAADLQGTVVAASGVLTYGWEGFGQTFIGVRDERRPFRVFTLGQPSRLVIDISH